ncbi:helix-turn-helix transcriptional regulator [Elizabethkingia anophelis]|uniref:helix-turn-helix transcriptional regulator n=1 Tax=Elizabethkingia anophelis TaxID=1117645 RepID=UPI00301BC4CF
MTDITTSQHKIHQGRNIKRFREMLGIKQDALAYELGNDWNQQKVSLLEQKEIIETPLLQQISSVLKIPIEVIENFNEEQAINIIANTFNEGSIANATAENIQCTFNPLDKVMELFERLIASEREKVDLMKEILKKMA